MIDITVRELYPNEWYKLDKLFDKTLPDPQHTRIIVAEDNNNIIAYWCSFDTIHIEPLWINEQYRSKLTLQKRLWQSIINMLRKANVSRAFGIISNEDIRKNLPLVSRAGFTEVPGKLYYIDTFSSNTIRSFLEK